MQNKIYFDTTIIVGSMKPRYHLQAYYVKNVQNGDGLSLLILYYITIFDNYTLSA